MPRTHYHLTFQPWRGSAGPHGDPVTLARTDEPTMVDAFASAHHSALRGDLAGNVPVMSHRTDGTNLDHQYALHVIATGTYRVAVEEHPTWDEVGRGNGDPMGAAIAEALYPGDEVTAPGDATDDGTAHTTVVVGPDCAHCLDEREVHDLSTPGDDLVPCPKCADDPRLDMSLIPDGTDVYLGRAGDAPTGTWTADGIVLHGTDDPTPHHPSEAARRALGSVCNGWKAWRLGATIGGARNQQVGTPVGDATSTSATTCDGCARPLAPTKARSGLCPDCFHEAMSAADDAMGDARP